MHDTHQTEFQDPGSRKARLEQANPRGAPSWPRAQKAGGVGSPRARGPTPVCPSRGWRPTPRPLADHPQCDHLRPRRFRGPWGLARLRAVEAPFLLRLEAAFALRLGRACPRLWPPCAFGEAAFYARRFVFWIWARFCLEKVAGGWEGWWTGLWPSHVGRGCVRGGLGVRALFVFVCGDASVFS